MSRSMKPSEWVNLDENTSDRIEIMRAYLKRKKANNPRDFSKLKRKLENELIKNKFRLGRNGFIGRERDSSSQLTRKQKLLKKTLNHIANPRQGLKKGTGFGASSRRASLSATAKSRKSVSGKLFSGLGK
jgi:hypothetical protein